MAKFKLGQQVFIVTRRGKYTITTTAAMLIGFDEETVIYSVNGSVGDAPIDNVHLTMAEAEAHKLEMEK